ncbi:iron-siderophore ABC transporter substrate-binding protein [Corynebacterium sp.]|uniref:iron-siderophore ABC transporter substrate-binding protein n=1 Tax=Corynebacterium sp. TaxID=1720 RepID=UPI0027B96C2B|nr:iron-siderophore ABC transporter substrate-binding protein [Corynebacterium sp.]
MFRRFSIKTAVTASLAGFALLAAGCSNSQDSADSADSSDEKMEATSEERIAAVGLGDADTVLALGETPVAIAPWAGSNDGVGPWSEDLLSGADPALIRDTSGGFDQQHIEAIAATDPTKIIAVNHSIDDETKKKFETIAPTTLHSAEDSDWQIPWEKQVETIAKALDKEDEGQKLIDETNAAFEKFREDHPELQGKTAAIALPSDNQLSLYTSGDGRGQFIEDLGFVIPEELQDTDGEFYRTIAAENFSEYNQVDYLFIVDWEGAADKIKSLEAFQNIDAVKNGNVFYFDDLTGTAMSLPNPRTIPYSIDKFTEKLSDTAK